MNDRPLALDFYAGAGGASLALDRLGYAVRAFDNWAPAVETHEANGLACHELDLMADHDPLWRTFAGRVSLLWASPPCQPFSNATSNGGAWDARDGFPAYLRALSIIRPPATFIENVPGLAMKRNEHYLDAILSAIADLGYRVDWCVADAADHAVPQHRKRVVIAAMFDADPVWPDRTGPYVTVREAIGDGADNPPGARVVYMTNPIASSSFKGSLLYNGRGRPLDLDAPSLTVNASGGNHVHWFDTEGAHRPYWEHLRAGGTPRSGDVPGARRLTPEQMARLQGFPSDFVFTGPPSVQVKQIGNAVPPPLVEAIVDVNAPASTAADMLQAVAS